MPDEASGSSGRDRARRRPLIIGAVVIVAVLVIGGATAWAVSNSGNSGYRMATVARATISESQDVVGTVEPVNDASASFQVAGQVATVTATVGEQVTAGESLATLDTTSLAEAVSSAESSVASDDAQLTEDEDSETSTATSTTTTPTTTPASTGSTSSPGGKSGGTGSAPTEITQDQATLVADQATASADQQQEAADLSQAETTCGVTGTSPSPTGTSPTGASPTGTSPTGTSPTGHKSPTTTTTSSTTTTTTPSTPTGESACASALAQVSAEQQAVATAQNAVAAAESTLAKALTEAESTSSTTPTTGSSGSAGTGSTGSTGSSAKGGGAGSGGTQASSPSDSAATIASDEAAIDTAQANLVNAQQSLSDAQLNSPIAGTIASVGIAVGATVSADSSSDAIVIIGTQSFEATATLTSSQVDSVKVGDTGNVLVDGATTSIAGTVSQVGPVQSSDGTYSYPLVVSLPASATGLFTGSTASISVVTSEAKDVVAVPTSAVNTDGTQSYVLILSAGKLVDKTVKVGLVGYTYTQVKSGLKEGESVVLADYSEAVPTSNTATVGGFGGGAGGFGGGGFGGGGGRFTVGGAGAGFAG